MKVFFFEEGGGGSEREKVNRNFLKLHNCERIWTWVSGVYINNS